MRKRLSIDPKLFEVNTSKSKDFQNMQKTDFHCTVPVGDFSRTDGTFTRKEVDKNKRIINLNLRDHCDEFAIDVDFLAENLMKGFDKKQHTIKPHGLGYLLNYVAYSAKKSKKQKELSLAEVTYNANFVSESSLLAKMAMTPYSARIVPKDDAGWAALCFCVGKTIFISPEAANEQMDANKLLARAKKTFRKEMFARLCTTDAYQNGNKRNGKIDLDDGYYQVLQTSLSKGCQMEETLRVFYSSRIDCVHENGFIGGSPIGLCTHYDSIQRGPTWTSKSFTWAVESQFSGAKSVVVAQYDTKDDRIKKVYHVPVSSFEKQRHWDMSVCNGFLHALLYKIRQAFAVQEMSSELDVFECTNGRNGFTEFSLSSIALARRQWNSTPMSQQMEVETLRDWMRC
ncbi:RAI1 like protein [Ditylenchus destructor]|uniref:Decapping nuclease n=1 Tax=Ditylenchus destructor TaxID=166010 RepID=A0AAD4N6U9_9BILA|nr:RAI1 like protein [Ditylenchus destructor]